MTGTSSLGNISTRLNRIAEVTKKSPGMTWTTLAHYIDAELMRTAYQQTRKDGASGIDGKTAAEYAKQLDENLARLCTQFKSGSYKAPPVRRCYIPKGDGKSTRPIGIPTFEDKVLQRAVKMIMEAVYEQDFKDCSYGFRPGRNAHQALDKLREGLVRMNGGWIVELDIEKFFDTMEHAQLRRFLDIRVRDGVIRRMIDKWLKAGVMEEGEVSHPDTGTPQGGVISPLLANIYLHEVLDVWFEQTVKPLMKGDSFLVRYADDAVLAFSKETDARRVLKVLPKRFGRFGLKLHPEKTRMVRFERPRPFYTGRRGGGGKGPGTFEFLGFTHLWEVSLKGYWVVKRKTARGRLKCALKRVNEWCRKFRHMPVGWQQKQLVMKLKGHQAYYGTTGNSRELWNFRRQVRNIWRKWLSRRSQRARLSWERYEKLLERFPLPNMQVVHSVYRCAAKPIS